MAEPEFYSFKKKEIITWQISVWYFVIDVMHYFVLCGFLPIYSNIVMG